MLYSNYSNLHTISILINGTNSKVIFSQIRYIRTSYNNEAVSPIMQLFHWSACMTFMSIYYFAGLIVSNLCVILCLLSKYHYGQMSLFQDFFLLYCMLDIQEQWWVLCNLFHICYTMYTGLYSNYPCALVEWHVYTHYFSWPQSWLWCKELAIKSVIPHTQTHHQVLCFYSLLCCMQLMFWFPWINSRSTSPIAAEVLNY